MKKLIISWLLLLAASPGFAQFKPAELRLVGAFHFNNPGADLAKLKTLGILSPKA